MSHRERRRSKKKSYQALSRRAKTSGVVVAGTVADTVIDVDVGTVCSLGASAASAASAAPTASAALAVNRRKLRTDVGEPSPRRLAFHWLSERAAMLFFCFKR